MGECSDPVGGERPFQGRRSQTHHKPRPSAWADRIGPSGRKSSPISRLVFEPERLVLKAQAEGLGSPPAHDSTPKGSFTNTEESQKSDPENQTQKLDTQQFPFLPPVEMSTTDHASCRVSAFSAFSAEETRGKFLLPLAGRRSHRTVLRRKVVDRVPKSRRITP